MSFFSKQNVSASSSSSSSNSDGISSANAKKTLTWSTPDPEQLADRFENAKSSPAKKASPNKKGAVKAKSKVTKPKVSKADAKSNVIKIEKAKKVTAPSGTVSNTPVDLSNNDDLEDDTPQVKNSPPIVKNPLKKLFEATPICNTVKNSISSSNAENDTMLNTTDIDTEKNNTEQVVVDLSIQNEDAKVEKDIKVTKKSEKKAPKSKKGAVKKNVESNKLSVTSVKDNEIVDISNDKENSLNAISSEADVVVEEIVEITNELKASDPVNTTISSSSTKKTPVSDAKKKREKKPTAKAIKSEEEKELELLESLSPEILATINIRKEKIMTLANELITLEETIDYNDIQVDVTNAIDGLIATALSYKLTSPEVIAASTDNDEVVIVTESAPVQSSDVLMEVDVGTAASVANEEVVMQHDTTVVANEEVVMQQDTTVVANEEVVMQQDDVAIVNEEVVMQQDSDNAVVITSSEAPVDILKESFVSVLARAIQGSPKPLQSLIIEVSTMLNTISESLETSVEEAIGEISQEGPVALKEMILKYSDKVVLGEEIKTLASREAYGIRRKNAEIFECVEKQAVWRWNVHVHSGTRFTKKGLKIIHDVIAIRRLYGKLIKAHHDVIKAFERVPYDSAKISSAEEKAAKATGEYEKAKEKRRESEQKKLDKSAEKNRKQDELDMKKREKEEAAAKKAAEKDAEAKEKEREKKEKDQKLLQEKEKKEMEAKKIAQKFAGFFKAPPVSKKDEVIDVTNEKCGEVSKISSFKSLFDVTKFEDSLKANMTMKEIISSNKDRYKEYRRKSSIRRSKKSISVMVNVTSAFGAESYSELKELKVDNRMRLLSFYEDHRPAYFGTISKKSKLSGRRPFEQDHELLNYDFDSEGEWEEDDGEDIEDSDGDDEEGANELEYDDFFRHDDDFGSDVDDDGDVVAAVAIQKREGEEALGPCFLRTRTSAQVALRFEQGKSIEINQPEKDKNVVRLRMYSAVVFEQDLDITVALESSVDRKAKEVKEKKDKKTKKATANEVAVGQTASDAVVPAVVSEEASNLKKTKKAKTSTLSLFTDELTITLINEVHNKKIGIDKLVQDFLEKHPDLGIEKSALKKKINEVAEKKKTEAGGVSNTWTVKSEIESKFNLQLPALEEKVKRKRTNKPKEGKQEPKAKITSKSGSNEVDFDNHCQALSEDPVAEGLVSIMDDFLESAKKKAKIVVEKENICVVIDDDDNKENILSLDLDEDMKI